MCARSHFYHHKTQNKIACLKISLYRRKHRGHTFKRQEIAFIDPYFVTIVEITSLRLLDDVGRHRTPSTKVLVQTECATTQRIGRRSRLLASRSGERSYGMPFSKTIKSHVNSLQIIRWPALGAGDRSKARAIEARSPIWFSITPRSPMRETNSLRFNIRPEARERYTARRKTDFDNGAIE